MYSGNMLQLPLYYCGEFSEFFLQEMDVALSGDETGGWEVVKQKDNQMLGIDDDSTKVDFNVFLKPVFQLVTLFAQREAKAKIRHRDWLKLASEKIRREQVGTVPTFLSVRQVENGLKRPFNVSLYLII